MTDEQFAAARRLMYEESVGRHARAEQRARDERWKQSVATLRRVK